MTTEFRRGQAVLWLFETVLLPLLPLLFAAGLRATPAAADVRELTNEGLSRLRFQPD